MSKKQQAHLGRKSAQPIELVKETPATEAVEAPVESTLLSGEAEVIVPEVTEQVFSPEKEEQEKEKNVTIGLLQESDIMPKLGLTAKMSLYGVIEYLNTMKTNNQHALYLSQDTNYIVNQGPDLQVKLFRDIMDIITKTDDSDFRLSMDYLMQLFRTESETFNIYHLMKFQENIRLSPIELKCYPNLMVLLTTLCDPLTRAQKVRREIDMDKVLSYGFSDAAKTRLRYYFTF